MSENTGSSKYSINHTRKSEGVEDQLDRLNTVIQNFMVNLDMSRSNQISCNMSTSIFPYISENSESSSVGIPDHIEYRVEEILQENDRLRMIIEDLAAGYDRKSNETGCTVKEIITACEVLKEATYGARDNGSFTLGDLKVNFKIIDRGNTVYPNKKMIREMVEIETGNGELNRAQLLTKVHSLEDELASLDEFYRAGSNKKMIEGMKERFIIECNDQYVEEFHCNVEVRELKKEAAIEVEIKKYKRKNYFLGQAQQEIDWQLNELKFLRQVFTTKHQDLMELREVLDVKERTLVDKEKELSSIMSRPPDENLEKLCRNMSKITARVSDANTSNLRSNLIADLSIIETEYGEDLDKTTETPLIPMPAYRLFTVESLQEQLKMLEEKSHESSEPERFIREIERCKTQIINLRGEQAIYECKQKTKNMFKIVKNIDQIVRKENKKRNTLLNQFFRDSDDNPNKEYCIKKEIEESLDRSLMILQKKSLLRKRTSAPFTKQFYDEQENNLIELRSQINALSKHDEIARKSMEQKMLQLEIKEKELKEKERFIFENWKKQQSSKELVETIQKISNKLSAQKCKLDKDKEKIEDEKVSIAKSKLENEINRGKIKNISNRINEERKYLESEKTEIERFLKQISCLPSYLKELKTYK